MVRREHKESDLPRAAAIRTDVAADLRRARTRHPRQDAGYLAGRAKSGLGQFLQISWLTPPRSSSGFLSNVRCDGSTLAALSLYALGYAIVPAIELIERQWNDYSIVTS